MCAQLGWRRNLGTGRGAPWAALVALLALVFSQLGHPLLVEHELSPEGPAHVEHCDLPQADLHGGAAAELSRACGHEHALDECSAWALRSRVAGPRVALVELLVTERLFEALPVRLAPFARGLLHVAPKTSPPISRLA